MSKSKPSIRPMVFNKKSVELLKQEARKLKRSTPLTHTQALDFVVQQRGLRSWNYFNQLHNTLNSVALVPFGFCFRELPSAPCPLAKSDTLYCKNVLVDVGEK